jgi:hypothetical protein
MTFSRLRYLLVLVVFVAVTLACNFPADGLSPSPSPQPVREEEIEELDDQVQETLENANGEVTITFTESQLTAYVAANLANQEMQFRDPQVRLRPGQMEVYGTITQSGINANTRIILVPRIDETGQPKLDVVSIDVGPFPAPQAIRDRVSVLVDQAMQEAIATTAGEFEVTNVEVVEGQMFVTGNLHQP